MANLMSVRLDRGGAPSWGFRLQGGKDFGTPLVVQKINGGSPAERAGLIAGDTVVKINNVDVYNLRHKDAQDVILRAGPSFEITVQRGASTWKPSVTPVGSLPSPRAGGPYGSISPVTSTSLAAGKQDSIGAIGTSHNTFAKPFSVQVNGGPRLVNKQYNSPLNLYSEQSIAETLSAQTEVLSNGVLGVNFKKNEKNYDAANSEVYRMVQEADSEPRDYESEPEPAGSGVVTTAPVGIAGLRHVFAPENKPASPKPQLPPGQNICADCERLIVGVFVRIKDKNLHVECFKCSTCGTSLKNVGYYNINNKLYCDVHAKLAARNNPPAPNLTPITVPPGGRFPSGISSIPSLPSPAPLSPSANFSAAPYQPTNYSSPRPFSSVSAQLSPSSTFPKTSPTPPVSAPFAAPPSSAPFGDARPKGAVWPPAHTEPELPTASPLYFPPPSQIEPLLKERQPKEEENEEEMSYYAQQSSRNMSLCSTEISSITGRRSECTETISDTIDTQMLVESIMHTRSTKTQAPERPKSPAPPDVSVTFTISEADLKRGVYVDSASKMGSSCETVQAGGTKSSSMEEQQSLTEAHVDGLSKMSSFQTMQAEATQAKEIKQESVASTREAGAHVDSISKTSSSYESVAEETKTSLVKDCKQLCLASMYEKKIKVENTVPHKWESPMVTALTVASDTPYQALQDQKEDAFARIPSKRSSSALASALAVAPAEPFTPVTTTLEPVPLPELTVPYFPPERPVFQPRQKDNQPSDAVKRKFKPKEEDPLLKDLPKPTEKLDLRAALTTAPDRPFSPMSTEAASYSSEQLQDEVLDSAHTAQALTTSSLSKSVQLGQVSQSKSQQSSTHSAAKSESKMEQSQTRKVESSKASSFSQLAAAKSAKTGQTQSLSTHKSESMKASESSGKTSSSESTSKSVLSSEDITKFSTSGTPPLIQSVRSTFETKTDKVQMEMTCQFLPEPVTQQQITKRSVTQTNLKEQTREESEKRQACQKLHRESAEIQAKSQEEALSESVLLQKAVAQYRSQEEQSKLKEEHTRIQEERTKMQEQARTELAQRSTVKKELAPQKEPIRIISPGERNLNVPTIAFQPVSDETPSSSTISPRPRQLTPSLVNKPAPIIPAYQASLVAVQCPAAGANLFDPTSPATSRPPSPYAGRPASPFPSAGRAVSPAPGPPPNPLQLHKSAEELMRESRMEQAKSSIQQFIPQHRQAKGKSTLQKRASLQQMHEMATITGESFEKQVVEEIEQRSTVKVEKSLASVLQEQAAAFHVTDPQPLKSPFLSCKEGCPNRPSIPKPAAPRSSGLPPSSVASSSSVSKPNTSQPNIGSGGGRQAPAIGVAPRRGRGILNLSATPGSRVPLCGHCHSNIRGPFITALGKIWCPDHFVCATPSCRRALQDLGFVEERGQLYCEYCFEQYIAPPCAKCGAKVKGDCLKAIGKNFHPECFNCVYCGKLFGNSPFFLEDAQPYCEADWNEMFTTKCFACGFPVEAGDRWVEALNNNYHSQCFNCTMCKKNLEGQSFFAKGGRPYCKNHAR